MNNAYDDALRYIANELEKMSEALAGIRRELEKLGQTTEPPQDGK